jgi:hypothetical protein
VRDKPFRIDLPFEDAVRRALNTKPISDAELLRRARDRRQAKATLKRRRPARRRSTQR